MEQIFIVALVYYVCVTYAYALYISAGHGYKIWSRVTELLKLADIRPINAIYV